MPLTRADLLARLTLHEDSFVERKLEGADFRPTIVAFANSVPHGRDAVLFIGAHDNGEIGGISNADSIQKTLQTLCRATCYPPIDFQTEILPIDAKQVLAVVIPPSAHRPHFAGAAYVREGTKSVVASTRLFDDLVAARSSKVGELQRYRDQFVTVLSAKNRLGHPEFEEFRAGTSLRRAAERTQAKISEVNSFYVRFDRNGTFFSEPLENLTLSFDDENRRPLILVHFDRP